MAALRSTITTFGSGRARTVATPCIVRDRSKWFGQMRRTSVAILSRNRLICTLNQTLAAWALLRPHFSYLICAAIGILAVRPQALCVIALEPPKTRLVGAQWSDWCRS